MKFADAIDAYIKDMWVQARITSESSDRSYRGALYPHCDDVDNRDPRKTGRDDVKCTLARWKHPNTQGNRRAVLVSFYDWMVEEGMRDTNPARQTQRARRRPVEKYRLTLDDVQRLLDAVSDLREARLIYLGLFMGLRRDELRGLQGRHFRQRGAVLVSADIGKGKKARRLPVPELLMPITEQLRKTLDADDYVFPAQRWRDPPANRSKTDLTKRPASAKAIWELTRRVGRRAGIAEPVTPHMLRHAYAEGMVRHTDIRSVQQLLGHSDVATTQIYLRSSTFDELREAAAGFTFGRRSLPAWLSPQNVLANPVEAPTGIEPV